MLRRPGSKYVGARTMDLLKVKVFHDSEAVVIGVTEGKGKHHGRAGEYNALRSHQDCWVEHVENI